MLGAEADTVTKKRVLVVEEDENLAFGLKFNLEVEGYDVEVERDGVQALLAPTVFRPDLILLDLMLPKMDGLELLRRWRDKDTTTRIIVVSGKTDEAHVVHALRLRADDYIRKPFGLSELLERVRVQLVRAGPERRNDSVIRLGGAVIDFGTRTVSRGNATTSLTPKEYQLLSVLVAAKGAAVSKEDLLRCVWGHKAPVETNTVAVHVMSLRRKIEMTSRPQHILSVSGFGYRIKF